MRCSGRLLTAMTNNSKRPKPAKQRSEDPMRTRIPSMLPRAVLSLYGVDTSAESTQSVENLVRRRAYELFEARGRQPGRDVEDWLEAEREVKRHLGIPS